MDLIRTKPKIRTEAKSRSLPYVKKSKRNNDIPPLNAEEVSKQIKGSVEETIAIFLLCCLKHGDETSNDKTVCTNCKDSNTPRWLEAWYSPELDLRCFLCNACGLQYHRSAYCSQCLEIIRKNNTLKSPHLFLTCNICGRKDHSQCIVHTNDKTHTCRFCLLKPLGKTEEMDFLSQHKIK